MIPFDNLSILVFIYRKISEGVLETSLTEKHRTQCRSPPFTTQPLTTGDGYLPVFTCYRVEFLFSWPLSGNSILGLLCPPWNSRVHSRSGMYYCFFVMGCFGAKEYEIRIVAGYFDFWLLKDRNRKNDTGSRLSTNDDRLWMEWWTNEKDLHSSSRGLYH